jgi:ABC-type branched-subunit amino acid transport system ATPase component
MNRGRAAVRKTQQSRKHASADQLSGKEVLNTQCLRHLSIPIMSLSTTPRDMCERFRILVVGRANAGKTTLLQRVCHSQPDEEPEIRRANPTASKARQHQRMWYYSIK